MAPAIPYQRSFVRHEATNPVSNFYDVQFYPYISQETDQIFAIAGSRVIIIARAIDQAKNAIEILHYIREDDEEYDLNSVTWSQDVESQEPLLCVSGKQRLIKVYNARTGSLVRTLPGHGDLVNDLITSPFDPRILASCSMDHTIRIWNLDKRAIKSPTPVICAGSHRAGVISVNWHRNGRWLLSGGHDTVVSVFRLPEISGDDPPVNNSEIIHYPHFSSTEVHSNYVDCVQWYGDLILSKCAEENVILLWRITGFSSSEPIPQAPVPENSATAPSLANFSRSAWTDPSMLGPYAPFQRLLTFDIPRCESYFMRFSLFDAPLRHPVLVMGNSQSRFLFWDLQALEEGSEAELPYKRPGGRKKKKSGKVDQVDPLHPFAVPALPLAPSTTASRSSSRGGLGKGSFNRGTSPAESHRSESTNQTNEPRDKEKEEGGSETSAAQNGDAGDPTTSPYEPVSAHFEVQLKRYRGIVRGVAWSPDGKWVVGVGDHGLITMFRRAEDNDAPDTASAVVEMGNGSRNGS